MQMWSVHLVAITAFTTRGQPAQVTHVVGKEDWKIGAS